MSLPVLLPLPAPALPDQCAALAALAYRRERSASRRLAARDGCSYEAALQATLCSAAGGAARLPAMLAQRAAVLQTQLDKTAARVRQRATVLARRQHHHDGTLTPWRGWFDGSAWPNPGRCGIGALLTGPDGQQFSLSRAAGHGNSSEAEYRALIALLETALEAGADRLTVYGDSKVVIDDVGAPASAQAASLAPLRQVAQALLAGLPQVTLRWIPRHRNGAADALSQQARRLTGVPHQATDA
ncbi:ribonuclease HI family protein [Massilia sp. PWRC2]|uniref:ribonuclease HI family protein n=1 Tax=Massilia sp. PWRC2 TaxID=2804626 RepID=UPI003CF67A49